MPATPPPDTSTCPPDTSTWPWEKTPVTWIFLEEWEEGFYQSDELDCNLSFVMRDACFDGKEGQPWREHRIWNVRVPDQP